MKKDIHKSPDKRKRLGTYGEDIACRYLRGLGLEIIDRNVRFAAGELDIVAIEGDHICFIEVKTRSSLKYGRPSLAVGSRKRQKLRCLAGLYLKSRSRYRLLSPRIDVLELLMIPGSKMAVNYIRAAL